MFTLMLIMLPSIKGVAQVTDHKCGSTNVSLPAVAFADNLSVPCGSTAPVTAYVYFWQSDVQQSNGGVSLGNAGCFTLPSGWSVGSSRYAGTVTVGSVVQNKYAVTLIPDPYTGGQATVRNGYFCQTSGGNYWFFSTYTRSFTITRTPIAPSTTISGPNLICSPGSGTFQVTPPAGTTVTWTASGSLTPQSGTGNTATVSSTLASYVSATGSVTFSFSGGACPYTPIKKDFWIGPSNVRTPTVNGGPSQSTNVVSSGSAVLAIQSDYIGSSYSFTVSGGSGTIYHSGGNSCNVSFSNFVRVDGRATNACGGSSYTFYLSASSPYYYSTYPNPASTELTIDVFGDAEVTGKQPIEIYLLNTDEKVVRTYSNKKQDGSFLKNKLIKFQIGDLPRGRYYLHYKSGSINDRKQIALE